MRPDDTKHQYHNHHVQHNTSPVPATQLDVRSTSPGTALGDIDLSDDFNLVDKVGVWPD